MILPGVLLVNNAGRDKGRVAVVLRVAPDGRLLVADGRLHLLESPKPKNPKHMLSLVDVPLYADIPPPDALTALIRQGEPPTNAALRRALAPFHRAFEAARPHRPYLERPSEPHRQSDTRRRRKEKTSKE